MLQYRSNHSLSPPFAPLPACPRALASPLPIPSRARSRARSRALCPLQARSSILLCRCSCRRTMTRRGCRRQGLQSTNPCSLRCFFISSASALHKYLNKRLTFEGPRDGGIAPMGVLFRIRPWASFLIVGGLYRQVHVNSLIRSVITHGALERKGQRGTQGCMATYRLLESERRCAKEQSIYEKDILHFSRPLFGRAL